MQLQLTEQRHYTLEEYLQLEEAADYKSEYIDGQIIPMTGRSTNHNRITLNLSAELNAAFKKQNYEIFMEGVRLWIPKKRIFTYPDVMVISEEPEYYEKRTDTIVNPKMIAEVLSKSTKGYDREEKFVAYRTIESFQEYLLIDQTRIHVDQYSKTGKKRWQIREYDEEDEAIEFTSVPVQMLLLDLYNKVVFESVEEKREAVHAEDTQ